MFTLRASTLLAVVGLFAANPDASAVKAPPKEHTFHGHIVHVHHANDGKHHGTITVKHHRNGDAVSRTFHIHASTTIHADGTGRTGSTKLHKGLRVAVRHHGHEADDILIHHHKKQK